MNNIIKGPWQDGLEWSATELVDRMDKLIQAAIAYEIMRSVLTSDNPNSVVESLEKANVGFDFVALYAMSIAGQLMQDSKTDGEEANARISVDCRGR